MAQVLVRNLDEKVLSALRRKAELRGHSLEQEPRDILTAASGLTVQERLALVRSIRAMTPKEVKQTGSTDLLRANRGSG